ncbi:Cullin family-domain-containing protein [Apiosordaria backusii]|uniref:Cullin family-domain-containing protein n=1 Tax=Apiosordaria backusii TaxID=314023 RepID=A0AA40BMD7_9PEZI|nr:Cullin family-domain-containing protein [Apiosordaria backusii]
MPPPHPPTFPATSAAHQQQLPQLSSSRRRPRVNSHSDPDTSDNTIRTAVTTNLGKRPRGEYTFSPPAQLPTPHLQQQLPFQTTMSAKVQGKRPAEVIDLTRSSSPGRPINTSFGGPRPGGGISGLQPHLRPRKLVIKNLRPTTSTQKAGADEYYSRTRADLDNALAAIFAGRPTGQPMERLYRGVEDLCRNGEAEDLYNRLRARCDQWLNSDDGIGQLRREVTAKSSSTHYSNEMEVTAAVMQVYQRWNARMLTVRKVYSYLDRSYLLLQSTMVGKEDREKARQGVNDMGITLFRKAVFGARNATVALPLGEVVLRGMIALVMQDRDQEQDQMVGGMDKGQLLKESVTMLKVFGVYGKLFEPWFLETSHGYFEEFAEQQSESCGLRDYIKRIDGLLKSEEHRCDLYGFDSTTKRQLLQDAHRVLIERYSEKLLDSGSVAKLLEANDVPSMKALYQLLRLSGLQKKLKQPWDSYIKTTGSAIVSDTTRGDEMVIRLLELRRSLSIMIRDAFDQDEVYGYGLRESFSFFMNSKKNTSAWDTGTSKVGEMIAKYIDMLLRGGLKTLPKSLLSDNKDKANAERTGLASTGDEDSELDTQLGHALELFKFIEGKDVFEAFYKKDLGRRLLMGRSASQDAERSMISKLKGECGANFTHNLEQMFKDQELSKDEMANYKAWLAGTGKVITGGVDLTVNILAAAAWPTYNDVKITLPKEVLEQTTSFDAYYQAKHTGRRLTWKHNLAHCVIRARFDRGPKELLLSAQQGSVLMLFNDVADDTPLSYSQISQATSLTGNELDRTLQSLACGKSRVLTKAPKGRDVNPTDTFTVNRAFTDPKFRVKINQIQLKETKEENKETHERVARDRQFETQAAIVRIMKSRKTMGHAQLVAEVINQTKKRGSVDPGEIKANIEKLIEKDYIEREEGNYVYLA